MLYTGIDPGTSGGIVSLDICGQVNYMRRFKPRKSEDAEDIWAEVAKQLSLPQIAMLERVHSRPRQGVVSVFTFGTAYGRILGMFNSHGTEHSIVGAKEWQREFKEPTKYPKGLTANERAKIKNAHKNELKELAKELFPAENKKIVKENADAYLIAEYCRRFHLNILEGPK